MSIGEALAAARSQAGLTISQVSQQTRIRETIIRDIERDDYSSCGGDFYARGHIRSIAHAVGTDPGPLISEYDIARHPPRPVTAADAFRPIMPIEMHHSRGVRRAVALGVALLIVIGLAAYLAMPGASRTAHVVPPAAARPHPPAYQHTGPASPHLARRPGPVTGPYAHKIVIQLVAIEDCWVEFTTPGGGYLFQAYIFGGTSRRWTFGHAVRMRLGNPGGIRLRIDGKNPLPPGVANPITLGLGLNGKISS
jgi:transcriptional regulator with XRE-family HTH domain